jgi:nickel-dependent lactate racemase
MIQIEQKFDHPKVNDYKKEMKNELARLHLDKKIKKGHRIAIPVGSRGIRNIAEIVTLIVDEIKKLGGEPFIVPAMGSHGGATPEGQIEVLESLGITEEMCGAPILSSMEISKIGELDCGTPVYFDTITLQADGIFVLGRIKPHTDFKGEIESGLLKMLSIGLGNQKGAEMIHWHKYDGYHRIMPQAAMLIIEKTKIILGLAIVENAYHETAIIKALEPNDFLEEEKKLLEISKKFLPRIPFKEIDVLIVDEIGKNISGVGMDTNVTGRFWMPNELDEMASRIGQIVVLDLSEESHGNAIGIGLADLTTSRVVSKIDHEKTYVNCLTQGSSETGKIPPYLPNDRDAIATALRICGPIKPQNARVVRIKNTQKLDKMWISEELEKEILENRAKYSNIEFIGESKQMQFDVLGTLAR